MSPTKVSRNADSPARAGTTAREILARELAARQSHNPAYTLRSFARDLDLSPSQVSRVLTSRAGLSRKSAEQISRRLRFTPEATRRFLALVELEYSRSETERKNARQKLLDESHAFSGLERAAFSAIGEWYHLPLMCLTELDGFREEPEWIARRLKMSADDVLPALEKMLALGLLHRTKEGRLLPSDAYFTNAAGLPSRSIRAFHRQVLEKAMAAIEEQNTHERHLSAVMLAVDEEQFREAQLYIRQFLDDFKKKFTHADLKKNQVYCLSLQYFGITELKEE